MIFNSFEFLWLFPIIFCVYWIVVLCRHSKSTPPTWLSNAILLIVSYGLYIKVEPVYALILLWVTAVTYLGARKIEKDAAFGKKKYLVWTGIILAIVPLLVFKYYNFISGQLNLALTSMGISQGLPGLNWIVPLGLSFYTFQAVGYLADVYLKRIKAEHNWWNYMLFVAFFPQVASGPISKAKDLLPQIKGQRCFSYEQATQGLKWILWGMFLKVVVADSIGLHTNIVFPSWNTANGADLVMMCLLYSFQIYCDFAGYSFMAVGVGELMGFELINNFQRPYFSQSVSEFWHRWHISLSTWLKDYIYIPLGGNRCSKIRNYINILMTFLVSGIWHGANWTFIVWGVLHGIFQVVEKVLGLNRLSSHGWTKALRTIATFAIITFLWIFFRMPSLTDACGMISRMFTSFGTLTERPYWTLLLVAIVIIKDTADEFNIRPLRLLHHRNTVVRWATYLVLLSMIAVSGVFGGTFIYSGF